MSTEKFKKLETVVMPILKDNPPTRSDDFLLYCEVLKQTVPNVLQLSTETFLCSHKSLGVPSYESVSRVRRKIQANNPELVSDRAKQKREQEEQDYIKYAIDENWLW